MTESIGEAISAKYRELDPSEVEQVAAECTEAWKDPEIPRRQYEFCVKGELEKFRRGEAVAPFDALLRCMRTMPPEFWGRTPTLLDIGASAGYYHKVLDIAAMWHHYTGCDYSEAFQKLAGELYPGIRFDVADARALPYADESFDIVLSGAILMHLPMDYEKAIAEAARVAGRFVIFHRTPVFVGKATTVYEKEGYGCRMLEIHFNDDELYELFEESGLRVIHFENIFFNESERFGHRTYLCEKQNPGEREWERA